MPKDEGGEGGEEFQAGGRAEGDQAADQSISRRALACGKNTGHWARRPGSAANLDLCANVGLLFFIFFYLSRVDTHSYISFRCTA